MFLPLHDNFCNIMRTDDVLGQKERAQRPPKALMEAARSHLTYSRLTNRNKKTKNVESAKNKESIGQDA